MKKIILKKGIYKYEMVLNNIKYCVCCNYNEVYNFRRLLLEYIRNVKTSEYSLNNIGIVSLLIDNEVLKAKDIMCFHITQEYSIVIELKLGTKSLLNMYLETLLSSNDYIDTINTLNILFESLSNEIDNSIINTLFQSITPKVLLKLLLPSFIINGDEANEFDLSYDDLIIFQLKMIEYITKNSKNKYNICLIEIPIVTNRIKEYVESINTCIFIIIAYRYKTTIELENILLFDNEVIDLSNEESIYNTFLNKGICTLEEAQQEMKARIDKVFSLLDLSILKD